MASQIGHRPEEDDDRSQSNTTSSYELAAFSNLSRGAGEIMVIRTLQRFIEPIFEPIFRPLARRFVEEQIGLAKQELRASMKENSPNQTRVNTTDLRRLKLKFRKKIALPVYTGIPLLGENQTPIEVALVDALTEQIVNTGLESTAKLEIVGFQVGDDNDSWTFEEFQEKITSERKRRRILQGNTCLQLKEGIGFVHEIHFTHDSKHTKSGLYRLGAMVVDAALMKQVELAWTESFVLKDKRYTYHGKHANPSLSDEVFRLQQIGHKGPRLENLKIAGVKTVKDLLILLYRDPKRLEDILEVKASSKIWDDIVKNAQASNGMFLYLDPRNEPKTGVVLDVKRQLKALIVEPHLYIRANQLSDQQKAMKFASENLERLVDFEDEASLKKHLQPHPGITSLPSAMITDEPSRISSQVTEAYLSNSNHTPFVTSQSVRGKEKVPSDDEIILSTYYEQEYISSHPLNLESPNLPNFWFDTEPGSSSQGVEPVFDTYGLMNTSEYNHTMENWEADSFVNYFSAILYESSNSECHATTSVCTIAQTRWTKVSKLLRRNSVRKRINLSQGIQPRKKQKCC
ncbi:hypothetical protein R6Q57_000409 [Mikania cordata]